MTNKDEIQRQKIKWVENNIDFFKAQRGFLKFDPNKTYAGAGDVGDKIVPDKICGLDCSGVFYFHDARFHIGGNYEDFKRANRLMYMELLEWIELCDWWSFGTNWFFRRSAKKIALLYYDAVCFGGKSSFNFNKAK